MTRKIMLIEDDQPILELMEILLRRIEYEPILVPDVLEALERIQKDPPDLILLDIMMTPMNGWEVLEKIREEFKIRDIPVLLFTASPSVDEKMALLKDPKLGVLQKPVTLMELKVGIEKFLGK
ncbi:response regulator [uncultured Methanoregula sp.]|uniref:response regulator n=1 Tax=uncultured Methanoregula sp. TaxID=1005933 RepID=UPI002AAA9C82|nr:response regulator [uncultured Methanoregula sp.]